MTCPECKKKFDPFTALIQRIKKRVHIQCPHCHEWNKT